MSVNEILQAIGNVGFPIVMCGVMLIMFQSTNARLLSYIEEVRVSMHKMEVIIEKMYELTRK